MSCAHAAQQADLSGVVKVVSGGPADKVLDLGRRGFQVYHGIAQILVRGDKDLELPKELALDE